MRIFLGSNVLKKGVSWRGLKGFAIFSLGFYTSHALTPNPISIIKEAKQSLVEMKSVAKECDAERAEMRKNKKDLRDLMQLYTARTAELEEIKRPKKLSGETI